MKGKILISFSGDLRIQKTFWHINQGYKKLSLGPYRVIPGDLPSPWIASQWTWEHNNRSFKLANPPAHLGAFTQWSCFNHVLTWKIPHAKGMSYEFLNIVTIQEQTLEQTSGWGENSHRRHCPLATSMCQLTTATICPGPFLLILQAHSTAGMLCNLSR